LLKQLEVFLARATKLFSVNMTNFEWDKKECVLDAENGSQVRSRFHQKKSQKNGKRKGGKADIHELLITFLLAGKVVRSSWALPPTMAGRFLRVSSGGKISSGFSFLIRS